MILYKLFYIKYKTFLSEFEQKLYHYMYISQIIKYYSKLSLKNMITPKTIGVVGGGISSLSLLLNISRRINFQQNVLNVKLFQRKYKVGGRIQTQQSPQDQQRHICADVGANYIDFQNQQEKKFLQANLPKNLLQNFKPFDGKFMIYENSKLKESQQQKTRYFYETGFNHMAQDWRKQIQTQKTLNFSVLAHNEVQKVWMNKGKWRVKLGGQKKQGSQDSFDILIFGTPAPVTKCILQRSSLQRGKQLTSQLDKIKYTKQISAIFELEQGQMKSSDSPYSILFLKHDLTFICFHQQKYPQNERNIAVIQTGQQFTQKWAKKLSPDEKEVQVNHNQIYKQISEQIWNLVPGQIKEKYNLTKKCLGVHYWPQSLIKPISEIQSKTELFDKFNHELNKQFVDEKGHKNLYFTGDYLNNKSRVTGAMAVGIKLSQQIMMQHFDIDPKKSM